MIYHPNFKATMTSPVQEIKERLDIVDFIRSYIPLLPAGKNLKALCPFHKEKTPSFMVSPERQTWHCFGACGEGGDIFKFLMKYENLEFYEALKILAEKAGIELKKISPAEHKQFNVLYEINEAAKKFFVGQLAEEVNKETLRYLKDRGLKKETIEEFELGFSPASFDNLSHYLINLGFDVKDVERAGLNYKNDRGSYIDRFRERIMFPIYNHFGKVVGFSGRLLPHLEKPEIGKYVNSPETLIFNKSRLLYGFHKTKEAIRRLKSAVLVEGQMDFLMLYQEGVKNLAAASGTALTNEHLKTFKRLTDRLILFFDNDEAGLKAVERAIDLGISNDFNIRVLILKDYKDPAEAAQKSPSSILELLEKTESATEFYFRRYLQDFQFPISNFQLVPEIKKNIRLVLAKIKNLASPVERYHWLKELSLRTKIEEKTLAEEMAQIKTLNYTEKSQRQSAFSPHESALSRWELIAQRLFILAMAKEDFQEPLREHRDYLPENYSAILKSLLKEEKSENEESSNLLNLISLRSSLESSVIDKEEIKIEFYELLKQLKLEHLKRKRQDLVNLIKQAEKSGEKEKIASALKEFDEISKVLHNIQ